MSHEVETMAYAKGEVPWHGRGVPVEHDLTPEQMMEKSGTNWTVQMIPLTYSWNKKKISTGESALVRETDGKCLSVVGADWKPVQNSEAFEFFNEFVAAGDMEMDTAGSLYGGQIVWVLAKVKDSFSLFRGKDRVESYMLFTNSHRYGLSNSVSWSAIRVVCKNTLFASLSSTAKDKIIRVTHRAEFNPDIVKETLGISKKRLQSYKEAATFLASKQAKGEDVVEFFKRIFPVTSVKVDGSVRKEESLAVKKLKELLNTQPGAEFGEGTWWQAFNATTFYLDHVVGRDQDRRLESSWMGAARQKKIEALKVATEMANAS